MESEKVFLKTHRVGLLLLKRIPQMSYLTPLYLVIHFVQMPLAKFQLTFLLAWLFGNLTYKDFSFVF